MEDDSGLERGNRFFQLQKAILELEESGPNMQGWTTSLYESAAILKIE